MDRQSEAKVVEVLNNYFKTLGYTSRNHNDYVYWSASEPKNKSRAMDRYFYTIRRKYYKDYERFLSGVYRYNATTNTFRAMKVVGHAKKKDAMARAHKLAKENK